MPRQVSAQGLGSQEVPWVRVVIAENAVLRTDDPRTGELQARGEQVIARCRGARLSAADVNVRHLAALVGSSRDVGVVREREPSDRTVILTLDIAMVDDYFSGVAILHAAMDSEHATRSGRRRGFGVISPNGALVAMTFIDVNGIDVETDVTVLAKEWRRRGPASVVRAAASLALLGEGAERFCTGGSEHNVASLAASLRVGYETDEMWLTFRPPAR